MVIYKPYIVRDVLNTSNFNGVINIKYLVFRGKLLDYKYILRNYFSNI